MASSKSQNTNRLLMGTVCAFLSFFLLYCLVSAKNTGMAGQALYNIMINLFGNGAYVIPPLFLWFAILYFRISLQLRTRLDLAFSVFTVVLFSVLFELLKVYFRVNGGWTGSVLEPFFTKFFGLYISILVIILVLVFLITRILRLSTRKMIAYFWFSLIEDIKNWRAARLEKQKEKARIIKNEKPKEIKKEEPQQQKPNIVDTEITEKKQKPVLEQKEPPKEKIDSKGFAYKLPGLDLLRSGGDVNVILSEEALQERAERLRQTLADFNIECSVKDIIPGPVITRYDIILAPGIKIQSVLNLSDNISLAMKTSATRIVPVPEKSAVGIEIPNPKSSLVSLKSILETEEFISSKSLLTLALGTTTEGKGYVSDLGKMPHLLVAGATGSGKSVGIHSIILSILYKARPDEVKFMLIDPKRVEMTVYQDIPHLYDPCCMAEDAKVITQPRTAAAALKRLVSIMEARYEKYAKHVVRNIDDFNKKMSETGEEEKDYFIVVIIDELADLMLVAAKEIEDSIQRLAQMARAVGIHLVLATQRPSTNVITGVIKANFPARIAFQTTSNIDSRVILDTIGAEDLIGKGDMLFLTPSESRPVRLQGAFVSTKEASNVVKFISEQEFPRIYEPIIVETSASSVATMEDKANKDLIPALKLILERRRVSQDLLKANFGSSARATNILSVLEMKEFISKPEGTNRWEINFAKIEEYILSNQ
ncbi:MAG: DNA translocase FtsK 4TM domain-containing protein [Endomicrobiaceae bacterium]|jgi:S-DNA-T family DNA segregation ATPase FtsK/SpoIIIE|nr:DNA translocase FtsK 4TM domain-containing protein [Endomicrobiaceae bacterium]MDD4166219.1 DNA translocase FtsK 4TM domain-containing protein [Endomicrobiaceae bacterium]